MRANWFIGAFAGNFVGLVINHALQGPPWSMGVIAVGCAFLGAVWFHRYGKTHS